MLMAKIVFEFVELFIFNANCNKLALKLFEIGFVYNWMLIFMTNQTNNKIN